MLLMLLLKSPAQRPVAPLARPLNTHFVLLPQMRLVAFHLEQKQKSFSRFLNIFVAFFEGVFMFQKIIVNNCRLN